MARVTEHTLYFSDVRIELQCNSVRISDWVERRWRGARQSMLPMRGSFRVDVQAERSLRIVFEDELLCDVPVGPTPENLFEVYLYRSMLAEHGRRFGVFHGGAVVSNGTPWVFCGPSGAGKSALVTAALRRGYCYFTDEFIVTDGKHLWGWPRTPEVDVHSRPATTHVDWLRFFERVDEHGTAAYPLRPTQVAQAPASADLVRFVHLSPGGATRIQALSAPETLRHWHEAAFHDSPVDLGALAGRGRTWTATWRDPDELLDRLEGAARGSRRAANAPAR